ncbi:MAG: putative NBD/HSP70 family sugar kinase [Rhodothermales bacterium]
MSTMTDLDPGFLPAARWTQDYQRRVAASPQARSVRLALLRPDGSGSTYDTQICGDSNSRADAVLHLDRLVKFLLWQRGASRVVIEGTDACTAELAARYSPKGKRHFDADFFGASVFRSSFVIETGVVADLEIAESAVSSVGRHLDGCRVGFDLGGSDRKCAAVRDGEVIFAEEIEWDPYFETDPAYHLAGINDSIARAAAHLPRVDAIGGSAAGVYVDNEVRIASLFRGVSPADFESQVRPIFQRLGAQWGDVPVIVINDGEVSALAGSMAMNQNGVLGLAMGTSQAVGYVTPSGHVTNWLNELAFAPVDYRADAPVDEWSGDQGCGVQYFSQQAVARLAPLAGLQYPADMPFPEQLIEVQSRMAAGDERAAAIYRCIGVYLGWSVIHYDAFYDLSTLLLLGRVTSGDGGALMIDQARSILAAEAPEIAARVSLQTPDERSKRLGQAVAAASLPALR